MEKSCTKILGLRGINAKLFGGRHAPLDERCGVGGKTISIIKSEPPDDGRGTQIRDLYNDFIWVPLGPGPKRLQAEFQINIIPLYTAVIWALVETATQRDCNRDPNQSIV